MSEPGTEFEGEETVRISTRINGQTLIRDVPARLSMALFLREIVGATSVHLGCEQGVCGACTVVYDGACARSCLMLAAQADGVEIETLEGASASGRVSDLQEAFFRHAALQCGYCTPAMVLTAAELIDRQPDADRPTIRETLSGNICRCTGYQSIVDAVETVVRSRARSQQAAGSGRDTE
jgi:aerobic carbon-monoxide dehydrogenase small subunit